MSRGLLRAALFALLAATTAAYVAVGRPAEAVESIAWYILLVLFALESGGRERFGGGKAALLHGLRAAATVAIVVAGVDYARDGEWIDAANTLLWVKVVALLECEVRRPALVAASRRLFAGTAAVLYSLLAALVMVRAAQGEWLDAFDAALWLAAFAVIEIDLLAPPGAAG